MPFCSTCGNKVGDPDVYCGRCGSRQPAPTFPLPPPAPKVVDPLSGMSPRTVSTLCYIPIVGWIASVIVLGGKRFRADQTLRFHAFQGLYIFAAWLVVDWAIEPVFAASSHHVFRLDSLLKAFLMFVWIFMMVKAQKGEVYSLPVVGELAHRSVNERRP